MRKNIIKLISLTTVLAMIFTMAVPVMADGPESIIYEGPDSVTEAEDTANDPANDPDGVLEETSVNEPAETADAEESYAPEGSGEAESIKEGGAPEQNETSMFYFDNPPQKDDSSSTDGTGTTGSDTEIKEGGSTEENETSIADISGDGKDDGKDSGNESGKDDGKDSGNDDPGKDDKKEDGIKYGTGLYNVGGVWKYFENGSFKAATGAVKRADTGSIHYVAGGIFSRSTGLAKSLFDNKCYYVVKGSFKASTGIAKSLFDKKKYYVKKGLLKRSTGVAKSLFDGKRYYVKKGVLTKATGIAKSLSAKKYYYVKKGVFTKATGVAKSLSSKKLYYVKNGVLKKSTGLAKSLFNKKYYYVNKGVFKKVTGVVKKISDGSLYYVKNGVLNTKFTGYAERVGDKRLIYIKSGKYRGAKKKLPEYTGTFNGLYYRKSYRLTGWRLIGRDPYYYKKGVLGTNTRYKGLNVDGSGRATGPLEKLIPVQAGLIAESITNDSMSMNDKLWACLNYVISVNGSRGNPRIPHYRGMDWPLVYANDVFGVRNGGNCFSYAAAFAWLAKGCGGKNVFACSDGGHAWAEVDGKLYDPEQYLDGPNRNIVGVGIYDGAVPAMWTSISLGAGEPYMHVRIPEI